MVFGQGKTIMQPEVEQEGDCAPFATLQCARRFQTWRAQL